MGDGGGQAVRFISLNTDWPNHLTKRTQNFAHIKDLRADIMFIQEKDLTDSDHSPEKTKKGHVIIYCIKGNEAI